MVHKSFKVNKLKGALVKQGLFLVYCAIAHAPFYKESCNKCHNSLTLNQGAHATRPPTVFRGWPHL